MLLKSLQDEVIRKFEKNPQIVTKLNSLFDANFENIVKFHVKSIGFPESSIF